MQRYETEEVISQGNINLNPKKTIIFNPTQPFAIHENYIYAFKCAWKNKLEKNLIYPNNTINANDVIALTRSNEYFEMKFTHSIHYMYARNDKPGYFKVLDEKKNCIGLLIDNKHNNYDFKPIITIDYNQKMTNEQSKILNAYFEKNIKKNNNTIKGGGHDFIYNGKHLILNIKNNFILCRDNDFLYYQLADIIHISNEYLLNEKELQIKKEFFNLHLNLNSQIIIQGEHYFKHENRLYIIIIHHHLVSIIEQDGKKTYVAKKPYYINLDTPLETDLKNIFSEFLHDQYKKNIHIIKSGLHIFSYHSEILLLEIANTLISYTCKKNTNTFKYLIEPMNPIGIGGNAFGYLIKKTLYNEKDRIAVVKEKIPEKYRFVKTPNSGLNPNFFNKAFSYEYAVLKKIGNNHAKDIATNKNTKGEILDCALIMKYRDGGDLTKHLSNKDENLKLNLEERLQLIILIYKTYDAKFIQKKMIHGDIKAENIIWDRKNNKIYFIDFATAREYQPSYFTAFKPTNTFTAYFAPWEVINKKLFSVYADIFSLGLVTREIFELPLPDIDLRSKQFDQKKYQNAKQIRMHAECDLNSSSILASLPEQYKNLIKENILLAYDFEPSKRPSCEATINLYEKILSDVINQKNYDNVSSNSMFKETSCFPNINHFNENQVKNKKSN